MHCFSIVVSMDFRDQERKRNINNEMSKNMKGKNKEERQRNNRRMKPEKRKKVRGERRKGRDVRESCICQSTFLLCTIFGI